MEKMTTKDRILDSALTLFYERGYDGVGVDLIAENMGMVCWGILVFVFTQFILQAPVYLNSFKNSVFLSIFIFARSPANIDLIASAFMSRHFLEITVC